MEFHGPPLGDQAMGHQNGPNVNQLQVPGSSAPQIFQRALVQKIGEHMISSLAGNHKAILAAKTVLNDILVVLLTDSRTLPLHAAGLAYNFSFTPRMNIHEIRDQIMLVMNFPASVVQSHTLPPTPISFWLERNYKKVTRHAQVVIPGDVVATVEDLKTKIASIDPLGETTWINELHLSEEQYANHIISELTKCVSPLAFMLKQSLEQGVVDEGIVTLADTAIPLALVKSIEHFHTSLVETSGKNWQSNYNLRRNILKNYARETCETAFILSKKPPLDFLNDLIRMGTNTVRRLSQRPSETSYVLDSQNGLLPVDGIIQLSERAFQHVNSSGVLVGGQLLAMKQAYFKPIDAFLENNPTKTVTMLYQPDAQTKDIHSLEEILKTVRDRVPNNNVHGSSVFHLSAEGKQILTGRHVSVRKSASPEYHLGNYDINQPCQFVTYDGMAYIVSRAPRTEYAHSHGDVYGRSPSLMAIKHNLFRVTVGDINSKHEQLNRWISAATTPGGGAQQRLGTVAVPHSLFSIKDVHVHTPGLSPQKLTFGSNELRTAFMDPALYDCRRLESALNDNMSALRTRPERGLMYLKSIFDKKEKAAKNAKENFRIYWQEKTDTGHVHEKGQKALAEMRSLQLHPFYNVRFERGKFSMTKRELYLQIPPDELSQLSVVATQALFLLAKGTRESELCNTEKILTDFRLEGKKTEMKCGNLPEEFKPIPNLFREMFERVFGGYGFELEDINYLFSPVKVDNTVDEANKPVPDWLFIKYCLLPVVLKGKLQFQTELNPEDHLVKDSVLHNESTTPFFIFLQDEIFNKDPVQAEVMSANTIWIVTKSNWPKTLQLAALTMQYCFLRPKSISALIAAECHPGFAVDFLRHEAIYSEQAIYTAVGSHEMILTPGGAKMEERGDGGIEITVLGDIYTTRNTIGAGGVLVPAAIPNENGAVGGQTVSGNPIITRDGITVSEYGSLNQALTRSPLDEENKTVIRNQLSAPTRSPNVYNPLISGGETLYPDEFVPMIRPVMCPSDQTSNVMGIERYSCAPLPGTSNTGWENFYTSNQESTNRYASQMGSLYAMRYTKDNISLIPESRSFLLRTTQNPQTKVLCSTTALLGELYDLSFNIDVLTPHETSVLDFHISQRQGNLDRKQFRSSPGDLNTNYTGILGKLDVPAAMGLSIPYTQTTHPEIFTETALPAYILRGPNDCLIISPFSTESRTKTKIRGM